MKMLLLFTVVLLNLSAYADSSAETYELGKKRQAMLDLAMGGLNNDAYRKIDDCIWHTDPQRSSANYDLPDITPVNCLHKDIKAQKALLHKGIKAKTDYYATDVDFGFTPSEDKVKACMAGLGLSHDICVLVEYKYARDAHYNRLEQQVQGSEAAGTGSSY